MYETVEIICPNCGSYVRQGFFPLVNVRCERCWTVFSQETPEAPVKIIEPPGLVCICGELITKETDPGGVYLCPACGRWQGSPGDQEAEKRLKKMAHPAHRIASAG